MKRQAQPAPVLHAVADPEPPTLEAASPLVREAEAVCAAARDEVAVAMGALEVARAKLREARDNAPVSARLQRARVQVQSARATADECAQERTDAERALADAEGALSVAQAELDDFESGVRENPRPAQFVRAREAVAKAQRAVQHAQNMVVARAQDVAAAEAQVAASEEHLGEVEGDSMEHSSVIAARHKVSACERALSNAQQRERRAASALEAASQQQDAQVAQEAPVFASMDAFVEGYVLENWRHVVGDRDSRWCALWWCHAEAVTTFEAMWEAFEALRRQPAPSLSTFLRDHFVPHMRNLTASGGTFERCVSGSGGAHHEQLPVWQHVFAPAGDFPVNPASRVQPARDQLAQEGESA